MATRNKGLEDDRNKLVADINLRERDLLESKTNALKKDEELLTFRANEEKMKKHMEQLLQQRDQLENISSGLKGQINRLTLADFRTTN